MILLTISIVGCSAEPTVVTRYVDRPVYVYVPVNSKLPEVTCSIDGNLTYTKKLQSIAECIEDYRITLETFNKNQKE